MAVGDGARRRGRLAGHVLTGLTEAALLTGSVLNRFSERGFTFIAVDPEHEVEDENVFLHLSGIEDQEQANLFVKGSRVEFDLVYVSRDGRNRPQARRARLVADAGAGLNSQSSPTKEQYGGLKFWHPMGYGFISGEAGDQEYYVKSGSVPGGYLRPGDAVAFDLETGQDCRTQAVNVRVLRWDSIGDPYADLIDMGHPRWANTLAGLAESEDWNYPIHPAKDPFVILRSYLKYTFLRLHELPDHLVYSPDGGALAFNTGLVTSFQEHIFALFRRRPDGELGPPWVLRGFEKASSVPFLSLFGRDLPPLTWYYGDPGELVFDTRLPLSVNVEHVPHDPTRFPDTLNLLTPQDLAAQVNAKAPEAVERVRRNYKTAIPQFYRDGKSGQGKMQLLLPVALLRRDNVELALAVDRLDSDVYLGRTVLTLDWAYNNARLLTRPDTDWLKP
jgi:cold shock CspA family protein